MEVSPREIELTRSLLRMAWADGSLAMKEVQLLRDSLIRRGCPAEEVDRLSLDRPEDPGRLDEVLTDHPSRLEAMRLLIDMAFSDGHLTFEELDCLQNVAGKLEISAYEMDQLKRQALERFG
ncbi:MAG: TerB family tellurite resistance protein [Armatimonadetes bacterium]|nr:TerB family tellurite resistance protein [Armatimonadota bacterium]